jgi:hypothetical protein
MHGGRGVRRVLGGGVWTFFGLVGGWVGWWVGRRRGGWNGNERYSSIGIGARSGRSGKNSEFRIYKDCFLVHITALFYTRLNVRGPDVHGAPTPDTCGPSQRTEADQGKEPEEGNEGMQIQQEIQIKVKERGILHTASHYHCPP